MEKNVVPIGVSQEMPFLVGWGGQGPHDDSPAQETPAGLHLTCSSGTAAQPGGGATPGARAKPSVIAYWWPWQPPPETSRRSQSCDCRFLVVAPAPEWDGSPESFRLHPDIGLDSATHDRFIATLRDREPAVLRASPELRRLFAGAVLEAKRHDAGRTRAYLYLLLTGILRRMGGALPVDSAKESTAERIAEFLTRLRLHLAEEWSLEEMAKSCGVGRTTFAEIVRDLTGESPLHALRRFRIEAAKQLLRDTDRSVQQIAADVGFPSPQYMSTCFRSFTGDTPTSYRTHARWG